MTKKLTLQDFIKPNAAAYTVSVLLAVGHVLFTLVPYILVYLLLMKISNGSCTTQTVFVFTAAAAGSFVLELALHGISTAISHNAAFRILETVRTSITQKMMKMPLGYVRTRGTGYFHSLLIDGLERLEYPLAHAIPETTSNVLLPVGILALLFRADWRMALALLIPAAATLACYLPMYLGIMNEFADTYYTALEKMNGRVIEFIRGNKEIKIFGTEKQAYEKYEQSIDTYKQAVLKLYNKMYVAASPAFVLLSSLTVSVLIIGGFLYCNGSLAAAPYLFTIIISIGMGMSLLKFTEFMDNFYHIRNGIKMINEVLTAVELRETQKTADTETGTRHPEDTVAGCTINGHTIVFDRVSFAYEEKTVLHNVSFTLKENRKTAIVGPSGAGKSTVANLIARFWDIRTGRITIGGADYADLPLEILMNQVNYVTQDPFLFNMSVMENIRIGKPDASDDEVMEAARLAQCEDFIRSPEHGHLTIAGDEGAKLSGGQRQRIIIARALLRNSPVLILDEATAFADMENQYKIQQSLSQLCKNKTLILIAHRLSSIVDCDDIIVLNEGKVEAIGTHTGLLNTCPLYKKMWYAQGEAV